MYRFLLFFIFSASFHSFHSISIVNRNENINEEEKIEALENKSLIEGDIVPNLKTILNDTQQSGNRSNLYHAMMSKSLKWPNGIVNFKLDRRFHDDEVNTIIEAMYRIERRSCIRFRAHKPSYGLDYVKIIKGNGCYSSAGRVGGTQILSLGTGCVNVGTIQHELLHSIGFFHTHMRMDRDKYLNIHYSNIKDEYKGQFSKLSKKLVRLLTPFDYQSIMIYGSKAFSKNNKPTMTPKAKNVKLTYPFDKKKMTRNDVIAINRLYKCTSKTRKRSSLIFFSDTNNESEDSEVDYPKLDDILVEEAKDEDDDVNDKIESNFDLEFDKLEKEKLEKENLMKENLMKENSEEQRLKKLEKERLDKLAKQVEQDKLKKEKLEKEKLEKEKLEKIKLEKFEKEKIEKMKLEKMKLEKMKLEKNKIKINKLINQPKPQIKENAKDKSREKLKNNQKFKQNKKVAFKIEENESKAGNEQKEKEKNDLNQADRSTKKPDLDKRKEINLNLDAHNELHGNNYENLKKVNNDNGQQQLQITLDPSI